MAVQCGRFLDRSLWRAATGFKRISRSEWRFEGSGYYGGKNAFKQSVPRWRVSRAEPFENEIEEKEEEDDEKQEMEPNVPRIMVKMDAACYGCGTKLQIVDPFSSGFVQPEKYEEKAKHKQFDQLLCTRCQSLSNGAMIPGVEDFVQKVESKMPGNDVQSKKLATPEQLRSELQSVRDSRALIVLLIDILDISGSMLSRVRDLVGKNPIVAIATKSDLLPSSADLGDNFFDWFEDALAFKKMSVVGMHLVSSKQKDGIDEAAADIKKLRLGRDVYIMGAANVGKSAFVRALVKEMSSMSSRQFDPQALKKSKRLPVESSMPGTTLSSIPLEVFMNGGKLYDTPGLHLHHRIPHMLTPEENKELHPRKKIKAFLASNPFSMIKPGIHHACYAWGGLARIHVCSCPEETSLTFFGPPALQVIETETADQDIVEYERGSKSRFSFGDKDSFGANSVERRGGFQIARKINIPIPFTKGGNAPTITPVADIAISGIPGWINITSKATRIHKGVRIIVETPIGIEAFIRPPFPLLSEQ